jgi:phage gpG-like protein
MTGQLTLALPALALPIVTMTGQPTLAVPAIVLPIARDLHLKALFQATRGSSTDPHTDQATRGQHLAMTASSEDNESPRSDTDWTDALTTTQNHQTLPSYERADARNDCCYRVCYVPHIGSCYLNQAVHQALDMSSALSLAKALVIALAADAQVTRGQTDLDRSVAQALTQRLDLAQALAMDPALALAADAQVTRGQTDLDRSVAQALTQRLDLAQALAMDPALSTALKTFATLFAMVYGPHLESSWTRRQLALERYHTSSPDEALADDAQVTRGQMDLDRSIAQAFGMAFVWFTTIDADLALAQTLPYVDLTLSAQALTDDQAFAMGPAVDAQATRGLLYFDRPRQQAPYMAITKSKTLAMDLALSAALHVVALTQVLSTDLDLSTALGVVALAFDAAQLATRGQMHLNRALTQDLHAALTPYPALGQALARSFAQSIGMGLAPSTAHATVALVDDVASGSPYGSFGIHQTINQRVTMILPSSGHTPTSGYQSRKAVLVWCDKTGTSKHTSVQVHNSLIVSASLDKAFQSRGLSDMMVPFSTSSSRYNPSSVHGSRYACPCPRYGIRRRRSVSSVHGSCRSVSERATTSCLGSPPCSHCTSPCRWCSCSRHIHGYYPHHGAPMTFTHGLLPRVGNSPTTGSSLNSGRITTFTVNILTKQRARLLSKQLHQAITGWPHYLGHERVF